jgi:hypothetical protein
MSQAYLSLSSFSLLLLPFSLNHSDCLPLKATQPLPGLGSGLSFAFFLFPTQHDLYQLPNGASVNTLPPTRPHTPSSSQACLWEELGGENV